ncbi:ABC transporter permease [Foetidibacter luteolus]|uniref:ABC transporter permease n=1 Tax=Foetidibacter luteolus TaxID=2608880 RepID=UPI001F2885AA|nr:ABC transporter permease [Foetidibacter luteolus]
MKDENRFWALMARKLSGEASEQELAELQDLLQHNPAFSASMELMAAAWKSAPETAMPNDEEAAAKRLLQKARQQQPPIPTNRPAELYEPIAKRRRKKDGRLHAWPWFGYGRMNSYVKSGIRNLLRNKGFSFINIFGLAIGMASAILLLLWIAGELSVDQFHQNKSRVYQVYNRAKINGNTETWGATPMAMAPVLQKNYPQVQDVARINWVGAFVLSAGDKHLQCEGYLTDPGFFNIFSFPLLKGNTSTALAGRRSIVVTEQMAKKLFGSEEAMGKQVAVDSTTFIVSGILKDLPHNTQFHFDYLVPWSYTKEVGWENLSWTTNSIRTFILVKNGVTEQAANNALRNITRAHAPELNNEIFVHPMAKWNLWSRFENGKIVGGNIDDVILFGMIAGLLLLVACINYMNLSTARSMKRAKEVGIRKVAGAGKTSLVQQFMLESVILSLIAGVAAVAIAHQCLPLFNKLTGAQLYMPYTNLYFWLLLAAFILLTGIFAGSYPSFYLAAYQPINVLKGNFKHVGSIFNPRKVLVVVQFSFAIIFIICTIVIYRQIDYGRKRDLGFEKENRLFVYNKGDVQKNFPLIQRELLASGAASLVTRTSSPITDIWSWESSYEWEGKNESYKPMFTRFSTDKDFTKTMGIKLLQGRNIDIEKYPTDTMAIMLNESAAKVMGFTNPVGKQLKSHEGTWQVVGVVKDFNPGRPYEPVYPAVIQGPGKAYNWFGTITVKLNPGQSVHASLEKISAIFKKYNPQYPFQRYFVDEAYAEKFSGILHFGTFAGLFAGLTIFISCLGIFALAAYMAENRVREIGVRKVLGASVAAITTLLSKDFLRPVLISVIIASPVAWWVMHNWLQNFSYRTSISWWIFALAGAASIIIALVTVSFHSIRAAMASPVKSLRVEG